MHKCFGWKLQMLRQAFGLIRENRSGSKFLASQLLFFAINSVGHYSKECVHFISEKGYWRNFRLNRPNFRELKLAQKTYDVKRKSGQTSCFEVKNEKKLWVWWFLVPIFLLNKYCIVIINTENFLPLQALHHISRKNFLKWINQLQENYILIVNWFVRILFRDPFQNL